MIGKILWFALGVIATLLTIGAAVNTVGKSKTCDVFLLVAEQTVDTASSVAQEARQAAEKAKERYTASLLSALVQGGVEGAVLFALGPKLLAQLSTKQALAADTAINFSTVAVDPLTYLDGADGAAMNFVFVSTSDCRRILTRLAVRQSSTAQSAIPIASTQRSSEKTCQDGVHWLQ